mmetsp:Transcript_1406/g.2994  ORF Transcript_1406/g.2994 Transcript_1406/m.2994 type:complete len:258 (+) Transcript_1406:431-1204(+)
MLCVRSARAAPVSLLTLNIASEVMFALTDPHRYHWQCHRWQRLSHSRRHLHPFPEATETSLASTSEARARQLLRANCLCEQRHACRSMLPWVAGKCESLVQPVVDQISVCRVEDPRKLAAASLGVILVCHHNLQLCVMIVLAELERRASFHKSGPGGACPPQLRGQPLARRVRVGVKVEVEQKVRCLDSANGRRAALLVSVTTKACRRRLRDPNTWVSCLHLRSKLPSARVVERSVENHRLDETQWLLQQLIWHVDF